MPFATKPVGATGSTFKQFCVTESFSAVDVAVVTGSGGLVRVAGDATVGLGASKLVDLAGSQATTKIDMVQMQWANTMSLGFILCLSAAGQKCA